MRKSITNILGALGFATVLMMAASSFAALPDIPGAYYKSGDVNSDGNTRGGDVTFLVNYFRGFETTIPPDSVPFEDRWLYAAADVNGDCRVVGSDVTYLVNYFRGMVTLKNCEQVPPRCVVEVYDADIDTGDVVTWDAECTYILKEWVFVDSGAVLNIPAGTIIKGEPGQAVDSKALIVARGGQIFAEGTADNPIIFTSVSDYTDVTDDLPLIARGLWGGVILLGKAVINTATGVGQIEGISSEEPRAAYGGDDDNDNSGVFRYVSIRHGGSVIGANNEINGLTLGAIGSATTIDHVEVANNLDDGFEWFGGTVDCKYLVSINNGDDNFDYDEGWTGKGQFWFAFQEPTNGNHGGEHDGGTTPEDGLPFAIPSISNVTYIGCGINSPNIDNVFALMIRDNAGGHYGNTIFMEFPYEGTSIEDLADPNVDSRQRLESGDLTLKNTIWWNFGAGNTSDAIWPQDFVETYMTNAANSNDIVDPQLLTISWTNDGTLDPRPNASGPAASGASFSDSWYNDPFFSVVTYKGAFDPNATSLWTDGWTYMSQLGYTSSAR